MRRCTFAGLAALMLGLFAYPAGAQEPIRFARTPKMSTYLVAFLVGDFKCLAGQSDGVPIRACATPDKVQLLRIAPARALEATFGAPDFYKKTRAEMLELETQLKAARDKVAQLYARWHELDVLQSTPSL